MRQLCVKKRLFKWLKLQSVRQPQIHLGNKRIFEWKGEKERTHQDAEHSSPGATQPLYLDSAYSHAGVFEFTISSSIIVWNSLSPCYYKTWMTEHVVYLLWLIRAAVTTARSRDCVLTCWNIHEANYSLRATTEFCVTCGPIRWIKNKNQ